MFLAHYARFLKEISVICGIIKAQTADRICQAIALYRGNLVKVTI